MDNLIVTASPHITDNVSTRKLMGNVVISLIPCVIASTLIFGVKALLLTVVTIAACVAFEYIWCALAKKKNPVGDLSAVVTGIILAMNLPASLPIWMGIVGAFIAIVLVKQLFGGLGYNFANPALVGRIVLFSGFATRMTNYLGVTPRGVQDALSTATPLQVAGSTPLGSLDGEALTEAVDKISSLPLMDLFLGIHGGVMGETCALAILIGLVFLVATRTISPAIPVTYVATVFVCFLLTGNGFQFALVEILSGGLLFGAVFMATDYVTSPFTLKGKLVYGIFMGIVTFAIRYFGSLAEGVSYSILLGNLITPYINDLTEQVPLGYVKPKKKEAEKK